MTDTPTLFSRANSTAPHTATWHPSPNVDTRGTWDIISICLSTLFICVWKAVHIDIPLHQTRWNLVDKLGWLVVGILAPDLLLYAACCQGYGAYLVHIGGRKYLDCPPEPPGWSNYPARFLNYIRFRLKPSQIIGIFSKESRRYASLGHEEAVVDHGEVIEKTQGGTSVRDDVERIDRNEAINTVPRRRKHPWTLVHSFYAAMGGFVFETSTPIFASHSRFVLTAHGARFLMEHAPELLPDFSEASILNRSRSDSLGKALLMVQLLYFCISCVARWVQSLPLTLLEVSTLAHSICAVATYLVWWKKPFDIAEPTVISGADADEAAAYLLVITDPRRARFAGILGFVSPGEYLYLAVSQASRSGPMSGLSEADITVDEALQELDVRSDQSVHIGDFTFSISDKVIEPEPDCNAVYGKHFLPWFHRARERSGAIHLGNEDLNRWRLAARAMAYFPTYHGREYLTAYISWRSGLQQSVFFDGETMWWPCIPSIIAALYGSCHLIGWDVTFPTSTEHTLWRTAAPTIIVIGLLLAATYPIADMLIRVGAVPTARIMSIAHPFSSFFLMSYAVVSSFLIFESIRQLLYLPDAAFKLPNFSIYLPHFA